MENPLPQMEFPDDGLLDDPFRGPNAKLLTLRVPDTLFAALERTAKKEKIPLSLLVRGALYFQFFPSVMERHLNFIGEQFQGEEALEKLETFKGWLDDHRERLEKLLTSYKTLRRGEAFALELEGKLQQLEKEFAQAWKYFAKQIKEEDDDVAEGLATLKEIIQGKSKKSSKKKTPLKEKTA